MLCLKISQYSQNVPQRSRSKFFRKAPHKNRLHKRALFTKVAERNLTETKMDFEFSKICETEQGLGYLQVIAINFNYQ